MSNIVTQIKVVLYYYIIALRTRHIYINSCTVNTLIIRGLLNQNQNQIDRRLLLKVNHILSGSRGFSCYNSTTLEWCNVFSCSSPFARVRRIFFVLWWYLRSSFHVWDQFTTLRFYRADKDFYWQEKCLSAVNCVWLAESAWPLKTRAPRKAIRISLLA